MIYLDYAASAPISPEALAAATPFLTDSFGNPSSVHSLGRRAALAIAAAREQCAAAIGAEPSEIYFTSGGTEGDNWAIFSALKAGGRRIVTTAIEHAAVLNACRAAEQSGVQVVYLRPNADGLISPKQVEQSLTDDTALVSVMAANNEIGTLQPIHEIGEICRARGVLFHTDAVQAAGCVELDMGALKADMLTISAHKIGGFKGSGLLYIRKGTPISPLINGGGQERGMRSGTENAAAIVALGAAIERICADIPDRCRRISALRDKLICGLSEIPRSRLNGSRTSRLCGNVNFSFEGVQGESLVLNLDIAGVCASSASACAGGSGEPSHVLTALGLEERWLQAPLRLTLSDSTTEDEIRQTVSVVRESVERLRRAVGFK